MDINKPVLGLGTFPFSGVFSEVTSTEAKYVIEYFLDSSNGAGYIETAAIYSGKNIKLEDILKSFERSSYYLGTKCVTENNFSGDKVISGKKHNILRQVNRELERLQTPYLDLLQAHVVAKDASIKETALALQMLKDDGRVRFIGVSNVSLSQLKEYHLYCDVKYVQNRFSIVHQGENRLLEEYCTKKNIYFNPYQIIERGLLTTYPSLNGRWQEGDLRTTKFEYLGQPYQVIREWVLKEISPIAEKENISIESLIIAWTALQPQVKLCMVGVTNRKQLKEAFVGIEHAISEETIKNIDLAYLRLLNKVRVIYGSTLSGLRGL